MKTVETILSRIADIFNNKDDQWSYQAVGKWGNKTLYRMTMNGTLPNLSDNTTGNIAALPQYDKVVDYRFCICNIGSSYLRPYYSPNDHLNVYIQNGYLKANVYPASYFNGRPFTFIMYFTKS